MKKSKKDSTSKTHVHPKVSEVERMLENIWNLIYKMQKYVILATLEPNEKKRDKCIEKIMKCNEEIEKQYSVNWH